MSPSRPVYNPSPFPVPAGWILRIDPFFYGGVAEMDGGWYAARSGDGRVPLTGPFDSFGVARECVLTWARSIVEGAQTRATETAVLAHRGLADLDEAD